MKSSTKKTLIISGSILAGILLIGLILAFIPIRRISSFDDFSVARVYAHGSRDGVQVNASELIPLGERYDGLRSIDGQLRDALDSTSYSVLHAMFEARLGSTVSFRPEYDEDGVLALDAIAAAIPSEGEYMLRLEFGEVRYIMVAGERVYYDTLLFFVPDSSNQVVWIDVYAFERGRLEVSDNLTANNPRYYYIRPLRMRAVTTMLYRALSDIATNPLVA